MILSAIAAKLKRRPKDDFEGGHFEAKLIVHAVSWYLRYPTPKPARAVSAPLAVGVRTRRFTVL